MKLQVLGTGCPSCKKLSTAVEAYIADSGSDATMVKIEDLTEIMNFGVMSTPAFAIDGVVKSSGKILTPKQIKEIVES